MNENYQAKYRSKVLWLAVGAQVIAILGYTGVLDRIGITPEIANDILTAACQILTFVGIINNPNDKVNW